MKSTLCFSLVCFFAFKGAFQTLTPQNTNPQVGEVYNLAKGPYFNPGSSGMGQVWNFSSQIPAPAISHTFLTPAQVDASTYTICNMGRATIEQVNKYDFLNVSSTGIEVVGHKDAAIFGSFDKIVYSDTRSELIYPMSAGVTFTDTWYGMLQNGVSMYYSIGNQTITADGTGTLVTCFSTYTNVLRVHSISIYTLTYIDFNFNPASTITLVHSNDDYSWYSPGKHTPVLVLKNYPMGGGTPTSSLSIFYDLPVNPVGIEQLDQINKTLISVNNPADNELQIKLAKEQEGAVLIQLFDAAGRLVLFQNSELDKQFAFDISNLENGLYHLKVVLNDRAVYQKKIVVQH